MVVAGSSYKVLLDNEKCNTCAVCIKGCPAEIIPEMRAEESSLRGRIYKNVKTAPFLSADKVFDMPPCQLACPIHQDITGFIKLIGERKYEEALRLIREVNALPSVTGYICSHPCEEECRKNLVDEFVSIKTLKRFITDFDGGKLTPPEASQNKGKKVSIIGSGPAGLAAAYDLSKIGYQVVIIEAFPEPGGMLRWAIPPFRLPRNVLNRDIEYIERMGVTIKTGVKFCADVSLSDLKKDGADAVILTIGAHQSLMPKIENAEHTMRYTDCLTFLRKYANGEKVDLGDKVVVIGAGNAGIDCARSALRCGAKEVTMIDILDPEKIAADKDELKEAQAEGIRTSYLTIPTRVIKKDGEIQALECVKSELGQRAAVPIKDSEFIINATSIISAIGQQPDLSWNQENLPFKFSPKNTFVVDDDCSTNIEGVFAAGDAVNGPTVIVEAMASGKRVASFVDLYLSN